MDIDQARTFPATTAQGKFLRAGQAAASDPIDRQRPYLYSGQPVPVTGDDGEDWSGQEQYTGRWLETELHLHIGDDES
jgi:hypothetical protein